ncbi:MAG: aromatic ring-hydroxylating dioxygenase subunit alpha [Actinomycetota bacterium]
MPRLWDLLPFFWHPVCRVDDVGPTGVVAARLVGRDLAVADLGDRWVAYDDRCPHRSARLSVGAVLHSPGAVGSGASTLQCAYHGWRYDDDGKCVEIPSMPTGPIPSSACVTSYRTEERYGFVWVLLDGRLDPPIPEWPGADDTTLRVLRPDPYTWPVGASRRVENFTDLSHFAFVHDGSLGDRYQPVPPMPDIGRVGNELRFDYAPPDMQPDPTAMFGATLYRLTMPLTVNIEFLQAGGVRRLLWMTASPVEPGVSRSFWLMGRNDELEPIHDQAHLDFQWQILAEDEPVVCNQVPPEMDLTPGAELSVRTDKVSIAYRRWLKSLVSSGTDLAAMRHALGLTAPPSTMPELTGRAVSATPAGG